VIAIIPAADRSKATVKVRVAMNKKDARIVPDMGVRVSFLEETKPGDAAAPKEPPKGVLVPASSLVQRDGKSAVFAIEGDTARLHVVTTGPSMGDSRLVEGIAADTRVVRDPPADLTDGARIAIKSRGK
jgi:hypothetical protein